MRITPGETPDREPRPVASGRPEAARAPGSRGGRPAADVASESFVPRSIARSQMVVAGLRQMQVALERGESIDVGALVSAVRFDGEPVLASREGELQEVARMRDAGRLARLVENTESNAMALLAKSGFAGRRDLLAADGSPAELRALLDRTIAALASRGSEPSRLRPERVIELLKPAP